MQGIWPFFSRRRRYNDLSASIHEHLDERIEELMEAGMARAEAEQAARREFGNVALMEQRSREVWQWSVAESLWADVKYALRQLRKTPGFTVTALLTLGLAIGANTATFSLMNAVLLRSLPVSDAQHLITLSWPSGDSGDVEIYSSGYSDNEFSYPAFERFRDRKDVFSSLFGFASLGFKQGNVAVTENGETAPATGTMVTGGFFSGLGVESSAGRLLAASDLLSSAPRVAVISYRYWQRQFARSPAAIGQNILLNGRSYTIAGVAAPGFTGVQPGEPDDLWIPMVDDPAIRPWHTNPPPGQSMLTSHRWWWVTVMGRLRSGVTAKQAEGALGAEFAAEIRESVNTLPAATRLPRMHIEPGGRGLQYIQESYAEPARILMGLVLLVLLAACANLATLLLARANARSREIAVRLALGASRRRVLRQLLTESVLLALAGGALGILIALTATRAFAALLNSGNNPLAIDLAPDGTVLAFTTAVSILTGILFGLAPALRSTRVDVNSTLKDSAMAAGSDSRSRLALNKALVVAQAAISTFLLVGAGLFLHSLERLHSEATGFQSERLLVFRIEPTQNGFTPEQLPALYERVQSRMAALPGVHSATALRLRLIDGWVNNFPVHVEAYTAPGGKDPNVLSNMTGSHFLETTGIPLLAGRDFRDSDTRDAPNVAIVDQTFAKRYFGERNPIGYHISYKTPSGRSVSFAIVGVCGDALYASLRMQPRPTWYGTLAQYDDLNQISSMNFELRTDGAPGLLAETVRKALREVDPRLLIEDLKTQTQQIDDSIAADRMFAQLSAFFGVLALLLAAIGLYGTLSYSVTRRWREIGIRMALGARREALLRMVLSQGLGLVICGVALGLVSAALSGRLVSSLLFGVQPLDWSSFLGAGLLLSAVAASAAYLPARRAASIDPAQALRSE